MDAFFRAGAMFSDSRGTDIADLQRQVAQLQEENKKLTLRNLELEVKLAELAPEAPTENEKRILLDHLKETTFTTLKPSKIAGVGVFALKDIHEGVDPFKCVNDRFNLKECFCVFTPSELKAAGVHHEVFEQVKSMFAPLTQDDDWTADRDENGEVKYGVLASGLHALNLSWYLNHSDTPNIGFMDSEVDGTFNSFVTKRLIREGEELTVDYRNLGEEYHKLVLEHEERELATRRAGEVGFTQQSDLGKKAPVAAAVGKSEDVAEATVDLEPSTNPKLQTDASCLDDVLKEKGALIGKLKEEISKYDAVVASQTRELDHLRTELKSESGKHTAAGKT